MDKISIKKAFGNNVRKYRAITGKNQEEFADLAYMSAAYLSELERGEKCPTIDTAYKISRALQIPLAQLLDFDNGEHIESEALMIIENAFKSVPEKHQLKLAHVFEKLIELYED